MSRFLVVLALGLATFSVFYFFPIRHSAPSIAIVLQDQMGGGTEYLPAVNGLVSGKGNFCRSTSDGHYYYGSTSYRITSPGNGQLIVQAHYTIDRAGLVEEIDRTLSVFPDKPSASKWTKVDANLAACAYSSPTIINY